MCHPEAGQARRDKEVETIKKARAMVIERRREIFAEIAASGITGKRTADLLHIVEVIDALDRAKTDEYREPTVSQA